MFKEIETEKISENSYKLKLEPIDDNDLPTVSIVTITYNRQIFIPLMIRNWKEIDYPKDKLEWIIVDDSDSKVYLKNEINKLDDKRIKIIQIPKSNIGVKRNVGVYHSKHDYIVHFDDDDFYPNKSVITRIRVLLNGYSITGCNKVNCYDLLSNNTFEAFDKYVNTISESTMAYKKTVWDSQKFNNDDKICECLNFIKNREDLICTIPSYLIVVQFTHNSNTVIRRVSNSLNNYNFLEDISVSDNLLVNSIRKNLIYQIPEWKEAIDFVEKCKKNNKFIPIKNTKLLSNKCVVEYRRECVYTKTKSSGKDLVYFCGPGQILNFENKWSPDSEIIGGSEEAVINLSKEFVKKGYNVTVYCNLEGIPRTMDGVKYDNEWNWNPLDKQDITIIWRDPSNCKYKINSTKVFLDLHDTIDAKYIDKYIKNEIIMCKSNFHKNLYPNSKNICVIPNGIYPLKLTKKKKNMIVCTSSPDRCLSSLLFAIPYIKKEFEDAQIYWAYGFKSGVNKGGLEAIEHDEIKEWVTLKKEQIQNTDGFIDMGHLSQNDINTLYSDAEYFIYGTEFPEIDCISLTKACSAGTIPIVTNSGAMLEKMEYFNCGSVVQSSNHTNGFDYSMKEPEIFVWINEIIRIMKLEHDRKLLSNKTNNKYNISNISDKWISKFKI